MCYIFAVRKYSVSAFRFPVVNKAAQAKAGAALILLPIA